MLAFLSMAFMTQPSIRPKLQKLRGVAWEEHASVDRELRCFVRDDAEWKYRQKRKVMGAPRRKEVDLETKLKRTCWLWSAHCRKKGHFKNVQSWLANG